MVEKLFTLGGKGEGGREGKYGDGGKRDRRNSRVEGGMGMREGEKRGKMMYRDRTVYPSAVYIL